MLFLLAFLLDGLFKPMRAIKTLPQRLQNNQVLFNVVFVQVGADASSLKKYKKIVFYSF